MDNRPPLPTKPDISVPPGLLPARYGRIRNQLENRGPSAASPC